MRTSVPPRCSTSGRSAVSARPPGHNAEAFGHAVDAVAAATATLLGQLEVRVTQRQ